MNNDGWTSEQESTGEEVLQEYYKKHFEFLDIQSKFLVKYPLEGGQLTMKAASTCQYEDGLHYIVSCYWKSRYFTLFAHVSQ